VDGLRARVLVLAGDPRTRSKGRRTRIIAFGLLILDIVDAALMPRRYEPARPRGARSRLQAMSTGHLEDLRVQARYARERYDLYKAKVYGPRPTSPARMRELQRECERTEARLRAAQAEERRVRITGRHHPESELTAQLTPRCNRGATPRVLRLRSVENTRWRAQRIRSNRSTRIRAETEQR